MGSHDLFVWLCDMEPVQRYPGSAAWRVLAKRNQLGDVPVRMILRRSCHGLLLGAMLIGLMGCRTSQRITEKGYVVVPVSPVAAVQSADYEGTWHTIRIEPRADRLHFSAWNKINPVWWIKNADDPVPPDWYRPGEKGRALKWSFRNPFHNFTFYVIGIADKPHLRSGRYPRRISDPDGGWTFSVAKYRWLRLPLISYKRGQFNFYLGWRTAGNFGAKLNYTSKRPKKESETPVSASPSSNAPQ